MLLCILYGDSRGGDIHLAKEKLKISNELIKIYDVHELNSNKNIYSEMLKNLDLAEGFILHFHGSAVHLRGIDKIFEKIGERKMFFNCSIPEELKEIFPKMNLSLEEYTELYKYFQMGSIENMGEFLKLMMNYVGIGNYEINPVVEKKELGIYYKGEVVINEEAFIDKLIEENKRLVGIITNTSYVISNNTRHIDKVIEELENLGMGVIPLFGRLGPENGKGLYEGMNKYFYKDKNLIVDSIISLSGYSISTFYSGEYKDFDLTVFEKMRIPVLQGITTYLSKEVFDEDPSGLDFASLSLNVYQPEMDGQIITIPIATTETVISNGIEVKVYEPIDERVKLLSELVNRYSLLKHLKNKDKKVAIILHNYPPRNDTIGSAHGLDTPQSLYIILEKLKENGYNLSNPFLNGDKIINELIKKGANDWRFIDPVIAKDNSVDKISKKNYQEIFKSLEKINQKELLEAYGELPGKTMVVDNEIIIPGIKDGNIFIGLQPKRSSEEDTVSSYHSLKIPPPNSYIGFYNWIDKTFEANAIIHVGTHGTLEWLPGKEVGLSKDSYPDINIRAMPHLYIYNLGILGEGMQTRRRSHSAVLSHLIPSFDESGTYEYIEKLEELLKNLEHAEKTSPSQVELIIKDIFSVVEKEGLVEDIGDGTESERIQRLHNYIHMIKNSITRDGLHVYGKVPIEKRFLQLVRGLMMVEQDNKMGLNDAILSAQGENIEEIRENLRYLDRDNIENYKKIEDATEIAKEIVEEFDKNKYSLDSIEEILKPYEFKDNFEVISTLKFIAKEVKPRLELTKNELSSILEGLCGKLILPSLGGNPTRGNINLLPTGRNFYSINPEAVPTRQAFEIGKKLGDMQLEAYRKERGNYPKNVAIVVYSTNTMKTYGEDIGEILYLMGVEPVYIGNTEIVSGVKVIPYEELKRPRVDVTLRISGLFRDTFPNIIGLIDDAVDAVIALEESEEINPIRANVMKDLNDLITEGISEVDAREFAKTRVYSAPSGTYGAGVSQLIESKDWKSLDDLADAYINWSSHGYSRTFHGERMEKQMRKIVRRTTMTIKNEVSKEIDLLDSDDFYNYHGGLIAAVRSESGEKPVVAIGNTADPRFVENRDLNLETSRIMRSRVLNPKWLEGLKEHGYKGAQEISKTVDILFGWDATADSGKDWMYDKIAERFLFDKETLDWMNEVNNTAVYQISERLLEANQRDMWGADENTLNKLREIYLNSEGSLEDY